MFKTLGVMVASFAVTQAADWGYDMGGADWTVGQCHQGNNQSPVDIDKT